MKRLIMIVEGPTEEEFVQGILYERFWARGIDCSPRPVMTSMDERHGRKYSGGVFNYAKVKADIVRTIKAEQGPNVFYTTMFDYYGRIKGFPGYDEASRLSNYVAVQKLEQSLLDDIQEALPDFDASGHFIPNFLCHEFEALLLTDISKLAGFYIGREKEIAKLAKEIEECGNPEFVNTREETAPSKRILKAVPNYDKVLCGTVVADDIGFEKIVSSCQHFREWLERLYALA